MAAEEEAIDVVEERKKRRTPRFKGFHQRIAAIKVDVIHRIHKRPWTEIPENEDTFFYEALLKWKELNCTLHFQNFSSKVNAYVQSLAQLVHHKDEVIDLLKEHLQIPGSLALESLLDLVVQMAKDLQGDFYPYFGSFFEIFLSLLSRYSQEPPVLECIFQTLGYLFKFLWRNMVKDMKNVFSLYKPFFVGEQKPYIQQFAAESCSFLMRKVKESGRLFDIIFSALDAQPDLSHGLGLLCFEMLKGVRKRFHSVIDVVLPVLLGKLGYFQKLPVGCSVKHLHWELVFESLAQMMERMAEHTVKEHCQVVERSLVQELERLSSIYHDEQLNSEQLESLKSQLSHVVKLLDYWVLWKSGILISDPGKMFRVVEGMITRDFLSDPITSPLLKLASSLLLASFNEFPTDQHQKQLTSKVFDTVDEFKPLSTFCRHLLPWQNFQEDILPLFLNRCQSVILKSPCNSLEVVQLLAIVILYSCTADDGGLHLESKQDALIFPKCSAKQGAKISQFFLDNLNIHKDALVDDSRLALIWGVLVCLPCIKPLDTSRCCEKLRGMIQSTIELLLSNEPARHRVACLSVLGQSIQSFTLLESTEDQRTFLLDFNFFRTLISSWPNSIHILQACYKLVTVASQQEIQGFLTAENLSETYNHVRLNLCSASHIIRLVTLKILACFDQHEKSLASSKYALFQLCVSVEEIPVRLESYRDRLLRLQDLRYSATYFDSLPQFYFEAAVLYLSGTLYVNFNLLWDPVIELITSFTRGNNAKHFWKIYRDLLNTAADKAESELNRGMQSRNHQQAAARNSESEDSDPMETLEDIFANYNSYSHGPQHENRGDHTNFRYLLWKAMASFPEVAESRSIDVVPLFLRFVSNEYYVAKESSAPSQDIRAKQIHDNHEAHSTDQLEQSESEMPEEDNPTSEPKNAYKKRHSAATKSLCIHLSLFAAFKSPKSLFKEREVMQLLEKFLAHREGEVQALVVKCLMNYKFNYLCPYKENIERLLQDEGFREELAHFSVDEEKGIVDVSHREGLMPILIRLLYGKMQRFTGTGTCGKAGAIARRSVVLRYLASCPPHELQIFMDLLLAPFKHLCTANDPGRIIVIKDLSNIVPLKKQQSFLAMASQILNMLGEKMVASSFHSHILQIILSLLSSCVFALEQRHKVLPPFISQLKTIRQLAVNRLTEFFENLVDFDVKPICDAVFSYAVWPQIENRCLERTQNPTALFKLLYTWSKNPRFFPLLSRKSLVKPDPSIMSCVFACLRFSKASAALVAMVIEMTDNLLSKVGNEESDLLELGCELQPPSGYSLENRPSYGTLLVLPHLSEILEYLSRSVKQAVKNNDKIKGKFKFAIPPRELSVLSKLSPFVKDAKQSATLLEALIPSLSASRKEEAANSILATVKGLLANVESPVKFVIPLCKLFSWIEGRSTRQCLCEVFLKLSNIDPSFSFKASELLRQINSWDEKRLEEPDYDTRLAAFAEVRACLEQGELKKEEILAILNNCIYFVLNSTDMSLRDSGGSCMSCILRYVLQRSTENKEAFNLLVIENLLPVCKEAIASNNEVARNEFLSLLSMMVRGCEHESWSDLAVLLNENLEKDFFENIKHIQLHRRVRALRLLQLHCQKHTLKTTTLTSYLLPLATRCIFENKDSNLVTEGITTIGAISAILPWFNYCHLLKHYLRLLPLETRSRKIIVRIIVIILNNFHFDLSSVSDQSEGFSPIESHLEKDNVSQNATVDKEEKDPYVACEIEADAKNDGDGANEGVSRGDFDDDDDGNDRAAEGKTTDEDPLDIYNTISFSILPQLQKYATKKKTSDSFHRLSRMKAEDEQEILRVPVILAVIKLLQTLPKHALQLHLPGLLLKVCNTLRSKSNEVRVAARETLTKITITLGIEYLPFIVKQLRGALKSGYQLHVLSFTLHKLLVKLSSTLNPGDLDPGLQDLVEVLVEDLFGEVAKEREVEKIVNKLPEAKSCKSYDTFEILSRFVEAQSLKKLITPLKEILDSTKSQKTARLVEEVLRRISVGLQSNKSMTVPVQLIFIHGLASENMTLLKPKPVNEMVAPEVADPRLRPESSLLLPPNPKRGGNVPQPIAKTNHHILIEFGLQMLYLLLKNGKISTSNEEHQRMLDPFVELLTDCLESKHNKMVTISLRSVWLLVKFPLPSLTHFVPKIGKILFKVLKIYAKAGAKVGENYEMVLSAFKGMTVIIRDCKHYKVAEKQLQILLGFVEEDIHDHTKQGAAFPLLKAILSRKLIVPEIHDVMGKVGQLSITGSSQNVQLQCRQCLLLFLLDYPLGKKLQGYLEFYVSQLGYEHETGRQSALEMLGSMFSSFPEETLAENAGFFFIPLTARLVNDDSANCRQLAGYTIKLLLKKLDAEQRNKLFTITLLWFKDEKVAVQRLAAQVCGLFVEVEGKNFDRKLTNLLPIISDAIVPEQFEVEECVKDEEEGNSNFQISQRPKDHLLFNLISLLAKVIKECQVIKNPSRHQEMTKIWGSVEEHLLHPHAWVRLASSRLLGLLFAAWKPEELVTNFLEGKTSRSYLQEDLPAKVTKLCKAICKQFRSQHLNSELGEQMVKNLVFLAKTLQILSSEGSPTAENNRDRHASEENLTSKEGLLTLKDLLRKLNKEATLEDSFATRQTERRSCVLRWVSAVAVNLGREGLEPFLTDILRPIHRELEVPSSFKDPDLKTLAQEALELIKGLVGRDAVSQAFATLQKETIKTRETRKKKKALEAVADPLMTARKKAKKNQAKEVSRKRKLDRLRPERRLKARRMQNA